jgi:hypothetical protein
MVIKGRHFIVAAGMWAALLGACAPALAQHGGGGHAGGGAHMGGGAHFGGGGGGGAHAAPRRFGGAGAVHYAGGGAHFAGAAGGAVGHGYAGGAAALRGNAYGGRGGYAYPGGAYRHGYSTGAYWGGGYWRGGYWPRAYYGYGYSWFLPVLPLAYATYWYGGSPYYYANDVYYTWNPAYDGYTATDPPPAADTGVSGSDGSYDASAPPPAPAEDPNAGGQQAQIFMYPKNGQSEAQQSTDKRECQQWAASQAGQGAGTGDDYRRAMLACVAGRGYSAN